MKDWEIIQGDSLTVLRGMGSGSVHCVVTSPPYWALRRYNAGPGELGSEATSEQYLANQMAVFREVRRVLRNDGVCWVNMGDTYGGGGPHHGTVNLGKSGTNRGASGASDNAADPGNACLIPQRLALALQADGWTIRSMIVWAKPAPMPESVAGWEWRQCMVKVRGNLRGVGNGKMDQPEATRLTQGFNTRWDAAHDVRPNSDRAGKDFVPSAIYEPCPGCSACEPNGGLVLRRGSWRPTRSHEYIIMATKGMQYFANQQAVMEEAEAWHASASVKYRPTDTVNGRRNNGAGTSRNPRDVVSFAPSPQGDIAPYSQPVDVQHFAAYPVALPTWCINASCPEKCCAMCGAPWAPVTTARVTTANQQPGYTEGAGRNDSARPGSFVTTGGTVIGSRPTCSCGAEDLPGVVLDPYVGTGTTIMAALRLGRRAIGIELSEQYAALAMARIIADAPMMNQP